MESSQHLEIYQRSPALSRPKRRLMKPWFKNTFTTIDRLTKQISIGVRFQPSLKGILRSLPMVISSAKTSSLRSSTIQVEVQQNQTTSHVTIIDWELAGWYPAYWEYAITMCSVSWN